MVDRLQDVEDIARIAPMTAMLSDLHSLLQTNHENITSYRNKEYPNIDYPILKFNVNNKLRRFALPHTQELSMSAPLDLVGFYGIEWPTVNPEIRTKVEIGDATMLGHLKNAPGIPFYVTYEVGKGKFANAIGFLRNRDKRKWAESRDHQELVTNVAPGNYERVDICHYSLKRGLSDLSSLTFESMKRITYPCL